MPKADLDGAGSVAVSDNKMLFIPGMEDQLDLGLPIAFTGLKSSVAADFADEESYRFKFDMLAQPEIITGAVFVHEHYDFDDGAGTIDVMANSGMGVNFSFDSVAEDSDHAHPDIRLACISEGGVDQGEGDALFTEFDLMVSNQPYTVIMDVDGDDQEGPLTLQVKIYESDQDEPDDYMATWKLTFGLGADPDPNLDHGIFIAALGEAPAALQISNLSICAVPLKDKYVRFLSCAREPGGSILVRWDNPFDAEDEEITIEVNGTVVDSVGGSDKEFVIDNPPDGDLTIAVTNYSGVPVECQLCQNDPPRALIAGARRATLESAMSGIVYDGSGSGDPEETPLLFLWELTEMPPGATAEIGDPFAPEILLTADAEGDYTLELTVTDGGCPGDETPLDGFAEKRITIGEILQKIFRRGDTDGSGVIDISDPIFNLTFQFIGGVELLCRDAADVDDSGVVDISDPIYNLTFQFVGGIDPPPAPGRDSCGLDPTGDALACEDYPGEKC